MISKGIFIDINYKIENKTTYAELLLKIDGIAKKFKYEYPPYFYVDAPESEKERLSKVEANSKIGEKISPKEVEIVDMVFDGKPKKMLKMICNTPADVVTLRHAFPFKSFESRILYVKRFMLDFDIKPFSLIEFEHEDQKIKRFVSISPQEGFPKLKKLSFDIETYNPQGAPRESKDPIIMISFDDGNESKVLTFKEIPGKDFVKTYKDEKEMIEGFCNLIKEKDPDVLYAYNSTNFDIPYLIERAKVLKIPFVMGRLGEDNYRKIRKGMISGIPIAGRIHLDLYPMMRFLGILGILKSKRFTLEAVYNELGSGTKKMVERRDIWKMWDDNELDDLSDYSLMDANTTYELGEVAVNLFIELSKLAGLPLFETSLSTSGQLVEFLLMHESRKRKMVVPPRPKDSVISQRLANPIEGAFVKLPLPGIYENIVVMDFRGLYPSIITSYNIDPYTVVEGEEDAYVSPMGWKFSKKNTGLVPSVLKFLVDARAKMKTKLKTLEKGSEEYKVLSARSQGYKIIANSFYGYLGYARSRWYNRKAAESVTAWGRQHIQDTIKKAEESGFKVLYSDTDSVFLLMNEKSKDDVNNFMKLVNESLPGDMELELEGYFPAGVFVGKRAQDKTGSKGAKKKYALLAEDGSIKIRGFALVRRDWSKVAKETQKQVLETILREKDKEKAAKIVKDTIKRLKSGEVPLEELVVYTQITKDPSKYDIMSPEVMAAKKAIKAGMPIAKGSIIGYVIGRSGKSISEKATPIELAKDYDPNYYINNQVLPSVMKILQELGYSEDDLKLGGKQTGLSGFF